MASKQSPTSPGSEMDDARMNKRKLSNHELAHRSRTRKQQLLDELVGQVSQMQEENKKLTKMIDDTSQRYLNIASENNVLRAQLAELTERLRCLNSVLEISSEVSGLALDIPAIPDSLLEPWQLLCPIQPIPTFVNMFQC